MIKSDGKNNCGWFLNPKGIESPKDTDYKKIDYITKDDILDILNYILDNNCEFDKYEDDILPNPIQATIYSNLYTNFNNLTSSKKQIIKEVDDVFAASEKKYL